MPKNFKSAFSFNLLVGNKTDYSRKQGKLIINIPKAVQKDGRRFALIGIDRQGKTKLFYDTDTVKETLTADIDIEGYAFLLVYMDAVIN